MTSNTREENDPDCVGVPVIAPVEESSDNPAGRVPDLRDHTYGFVPPVADRLAEYETPTLPFCKADVATTGGTSGLTSRLRLLELAEFLAASVTTKIRALAVPADEGVPLTAPAEDREIPAGRVPDVSVH